MNPQTKELIDKFGVDVVFDTMIRCLQISKQYERETGEKLNPQHLVAVVSALNKENNCG
jgi:hypothetical protein